MEKYWSTLLTEWTRKGRDGFTLPFIIGSQKFLGALTKHQDIADLLTDIVDSDNPKIYIKYCLTTEEIILGVYDEKQSSLKGTFPNRDGQPQRQLFLTLFLYDLGDKVEDIIQSLTNKYQQYIDKEEFSKHTDRTWGDFNVDDKTFIYSTFRTHGLID